MSLIYLTNACCEDTGHLTAELLAAAGFGYTDDEDGFYPLTEAEAGYVADDALGCAGHEVLLGYSVLMEGRKWLAPTLRILHADPEASESDYLSPGNALALAKVLEAVLSPRVQAFGGRVLLDDDEPYATCLVIVLPFEVAQLVGDFAAWRAFLMSYLLDPVAPVAEGHGVGDSPLAMPLVMEVNTLADGDELHPEGAAISVTPALLARLWDLVAVVAKGPMSELRADPGLIEWLGGDSDSWEIVELAVFGDSLQWVGHPPVAGAPFETQRVSLLALAKAFVGGASVAVVNEGGYELLTDEQARDSDLYEQWQEAVYGEALA